MNNFNHEQKTNKFDNRDDIMNYLFPNVWEPKVKGMNTMGEVADSIFKTH